MANNKGYGVHLTKYAKYSTEDLEKLFRDESWFKMNENDRQQLLQETVNRSAAQKGEVGSCEIVFKDLGSGTYGQQSGNVIELNRDIFVLDKYVKEYKGYKIEEKVKDSNMKALETVLHEDIHAWQNQCMDGTITNINPDLLKEYRANNFTISLVPDGQGGQTLGSNYLSGENGDAGYLMYYFQSTERDAHLYSQRQTMDIINRLQQYEKSEDQISESFTVYRNSILQDGYQAEYRRGQKVFNNKNFDEEINKVLMNQYYGTNYKVDPNIQSAVQQEMASSYKALNRPSISTNTGSTNENTEKVGEATAEIDAGGGLE